MKRMQCSAKVLRKKPSGERWSPGQALWLRDEPTKDDWRPCQKVARVWPDMPGLAGLPLCFLHACQFEAQARDPEHHQEQPWMREIKARTEVQA